MKKISIISVSVTTMLLSACGSTGTGYMTARHNGLLYYSSIPCPQYRYSYNEPDTLYCYDKDNNFSHTINPLPPEAVAHYHREREANRRAMNDFFNSTNQSINNVAQGYQQSAQMLNSMSSDMARRNCLQQQQMAQMQQRNYPNAPVWIPTCY